MLHPEFNWHGNAFQFLINGHREGGDAVYLVEEGFLISPKIQSLTGYRTVSRSQFTKIVDFLMRPSLKCSSVNGVKKGETCWRASRLTERRAELPPGEIVKSITWSVFNCQKLGLGIR